MTYEGEWVTDELDLQAVIYTDTKLTQTVEQADSYTGYGVGVYPYGDKYEGNWKDGMRHGQGKHYYFSDYSLEGEFIDNKREGVFTSSYATGSHKEIYANNAFVEFVEEEED